MATLDEHGREVLDQTPVSVPFKFERPEPIHLRLRRQIIDAMVAAERDGEHETVEDFNDFRIEGEPDSYDDGRSPYEEDAFTGKVPMEEALEQARQEAEQKEREHYEALKKKYAEPHQQTTSAGDGSEPPQAAPEA